MGFLSDILKPVGIGVGAAALGGLLFPETVGSLTGGLFGASAADGGSSIFSNPTVLSSGILAGTSLLSGLFGSSSEEDQLALQQSTLEEQRRQFDEKMKLEAQQLAQALQIAKINASASGGASNAAGITARTNRDIAKASAIGNAASQKADALQIPLKARENQIAAAQTTGSQSGQFFNQLMQGLQAPALVAAR